MAIGSFPIWFNDFPINTLHWSIFSMPCVIAQQAPISDNWSGWSSARLSGHRSSSYFHCLQFLHILGGFLSHGGYPQSWCSRIFWYLHLRKSYCFNLVGGARTILKNMSSSMGRMTSHDYPIYEMDKNVPKHQPVTHKKVMILPQSCSEHPAFG